MKVNWLGNGRLFCRNSKHSILQLKLYITYNFSVACVSILIFICSGDTRVGPGILGGTMNGTNRDVFKPSSESEVIASPQALLNSPFYEKPYSDNGINIQKSHVPVNGSTFRRYTVFKRQESFVKNTTTCCDFGSFIKRKHSWRTCFL